MKSKIIFPLLICLVLCACGTQKNIIASKTQTSTLQKTPQKNSVDIDMENGNIEALIRDYHNRTEYREAISTYLFDSHSYKDATYAQLNRYKSLCQDSILQNGLNKEINIYEANVLDSFSRMSNKQIASYYQHHKDEQDYLRPAIMSVIMSDLPDKDYYSLRTLKRTFWYTDLQDSVNPEYLRKRKLLLPAIQKSIENYCQKEYQILDQYRQMCQDSLYNHIVQASEKALDAIMDDDLPKTQAEVSNRYKAVCANAIDVTIIKACIRKCMSEVIPTINASRSEYLNT